MERQPSSSSSARVPSEGGTKSSRSSLTFISPSLFCFIIPSSLLLIFFPSKCISHSATPTQMLFFCFVFVLFSVFWPLSFVNLHVFHFCHPLSFSLLLSVPPVSTPPLSLSHVLSHAPSLCLFFVILVCLTTGTEMVLEARQTLGDIVLWCMLRQQYFPSAPECLSPPLSVLAFCYAHSSAATMSSSPAAPLASLAHPVEGFSGLL